MGGDLVQSLTFDPGVLWSLDVHKTFPFSDSLPWRMCHSVRASNPEKPQQGDTGMRQRSL